MVGGVAERSKLLLEHIGDVEIGKGFLNSIIFLGIPVLHFLLQNKLFGGFH